MVRITDAGYDFTGEVAPAPATTKELLDMWRNALKAGARRMLDVVVDQYPDSMTREELAELIEMEPSGGTFQTYVSTLRRNGLIEVTGEGIRASSDLFAGV